LFLPFARLTGAIIRSAFPSHACALRSVGAIRASGSRRSQKDYVSKRMQIDEKPLLAPARTTLSLIQLR